ncbi:aminobenzoate synthetase [Achromobacter insolitus]|uniref:aminotransferase class IV family protein n=1 Tax=Achromobacter insolitus TaxID=217204 RepID=UPI0007C63743|nr:aminotransferase class IV family protein [Achromobacter insolitus]OAE64318.1 aminobenzoate synthetase [Achromobacter insolitus]OCZ60317.1 aminobenzoate synthetase [Achromobacter insolitus]
MQPELIETILVDAERRVPLLARHLKRLEASCKALGYGWGGRAVEADIMITALGVSTPGPHRLRLLVARDGSRNIQTAPLPPLPPGQEAMLAPEALRSSEPLLRYKTTYRPWYTKTIEWLPSHPHIFDLLYLNERGELCEGSRSNIYLRLDGDWYTPPVDSGCLPGVQRAELLDTEQVEERVLTLADLHAAEEIRLSNALRGWFPVVLRDA